jgi:glycosyltransferase involved in cell wall biosynthesis
LLVTTAIFVTPLLDPDSPVRGFATTHVRALAGRFDRVVVVAGSARGDLGGLEAQVVTPDASDPSLGVLGIGPPLARVLADTDDPALVVVDNDQACLLQARSLMHDLRTPLLWWCPRIPSPHAATEAARWADALLVAAPPSSPVVGCPVFSVGAGIDLGAATGASGFPERPPLRLIAVGRTSPRKGLPVIVRTVAIARSNGIDARLLIVGPSTNAAEWQHRGELERLVNDLALTDSVRVAKAMTPRCVGEMVRQAHVLVDAGCGNDLSRSALEAMAAGRIVVSASAALAPMLERAGPVPLSFVAGSATQLAERIAGLSAAWSSRAQDIAGALRAEVEQGHSAEQWAEHVAKAACASGESAS